jgi:hypothetical protein
MKIHPVESELFLADSRTEGRTDGRTEMTKLMLFLRKFVNAPKTTSLSLYRIYLLVLVADRECVYCALQT